MSESGPFQINVGDNSKKEEKKEPEEELLPFLKKKIEENVINLSYNQDGKRNGTIGVILGRMYQAILFELDKEKK